MATMDLMVLEPQPFSSPLEGRRHGLLPSAITMQADLGPEACPSVSRQLLMEHEAGEPVPLAVGEGIDHGTTGRTRA